MKRIAIFADGTWNSPDDIHSTNVLAMARAVKPEVGGIEQVAFYDWGVGTDRKKVMGGLTGEGIDKNILDCYRFLVHNYNKGDHLFFFGFSRGAYTVRSLAGFIRNCGLMKREFAEHIPEAYRLYRKRTHSSDPDSESAREFRRQFSVADITPIEFVGVWDTVGSLGIPVPFWGSLGKDSFLFHDCCPSKIIQHARHAVSIDENRVDFEPTLWEERPGFDIKQVWFAGVHSDIGGGYKENGLSHCASKWMLREASHFGLKFEPHFTHSLHDDANDTQHNEYKGIFKARGKKDRIITGPIHDSVKVRWHNNAHDYQKKSKSMRHLLDTVNGDWRKVPVEH